MFTRPLPVNDRGGTQTHRLMGFVKYAVEMGSGVIIYIPSFVKIGLGIQHLIGRYIHRQQGDLIGLLLFTFLK
jgi:hypothetical protein